MNSDRQDSDILVFTAVLDREKEAYRVIIESATQSKSNGLMRKDRSTSSPG